MIEGDVAQALQHDLSVLGYYSGRLTGGWDAPSQAAFTRFIGEHNFENKARDDGKVWPSIVRYLKERAQAETERRTHTAPIVPGALSRGPGAPPPGGTASPPASRKGPGVELTIRLRGSFTDATTAHRVVEAVLGRQPVVRHGGGRRERHRGPPDRLLRSERPDERSRTFSRVPRAAERTTTRSGQSFQARPK